MVMVADAGFEQYTPPRTPVALLEAFIDDDESMSRMLDTVYTDSDELVDAMDITGRLLPRWGLDHLVPFNTAYLSLSRDVGDAVKGRSNKFEFSHPQVVERTMGIFAELYFRQIREYHRMGIKGVDEAWRPLFDSNAGKNASPGIQFLLGMNAHIVYDLPQALLKSGVTEDYYADYTKVVGGLIDEVAKYMAPAYVPGTKGVRNFLTRKTVKRIAVWREDAWNAGKELLAVQRATRKEYEWDDEALLLQLKEDEDSDERAPAPSGRIATRAVLGECKRRALRNARMIGIMGRAALMGVASVAGEPPEDVSNIVHLRARAKQEEQQPLAA
jgi:hypothetical protein